MKWLDKLERKYGRYAIRGLMKYIVAANLAVFLLITIMPNLLGDLMLIPQLVMHGQIWRIFTFILIPPNFDAFWILFTLYFYYVIGESLEQAWGTFKFNMYYLLGVIIVIVVSLVFGVIGSTFILNTSLFLAYATLYPEREVLLFFVLPIKLKVMGAIYGILLVGNLIVGAFGIRLMTIASLANYFIFFWPDFLALFKMKKVVKKNREKFKVIEMKDYARHRCSVCGITERDNPDMEFRYCSKCSGHKEYCTDHLKNHEHTTE